MRIDWHSASIQRTIYNLLPLSQNRMYSFGFGIKQGRSSSIGAKILSFMFKQSMDDL